MKSTSRLRHCLVATLLAASLAQTGIAASIAGSRPSQVSQARIRSTADPEQPLRNLPARIKRYLLWLYDELEIPKP